MSKQAINNYYNKISQYKRFGGTRNETSMRRAFANLLEEYCLPKNRTLVDEISVEPRTNAALPHRKRPDGTIKDVHTLEYGYWESKDPQDNLDEQIKKKIELGYPTFNILFENSEIAILIQKDVEVMRGSMDNADFLHTIITQFVDYERPEIKEFHSAVEKFKQDVPDIVEALRAMIEEQAINNVDFRIQREKFWNVCRESINPEISASDIREMLIQHILTAEIFDTVFGDSHFHRENNIARELEVVINTFFTGAVRRNTLSAIDSYYKAIKAEAARIDNHHEKQKFLKVVYETFYKAYNPKGADRLGVVYTPNEIVKFMVESTDYLLEKHFNKSLAEKNVQIIDPATGTGTFITEIIEHIPPQYLKYKYQNEIHCNEVAILPYYIANLNIEFTYQQKMNEYQAFENIVFVDTLDNLGFEFVGKQQKLYAMTAENLERIIKQNEKKISVIIGNPPYNANQQSENDNNKNKVYTEIDKRIRETYIRQSKAQKNKVYDMYTRFFRWASDRISEDGIICFVSNSSFINARGFDGFRKSIEKEFNFTYIIDLGGDINAEGQNAKGNVFDIKVGVSIIFLVKKKEDLFMNLQNINKIFYYKVEAENKIEKIEFLKDMSQLNRFASIPFERIQPNNRGIWINIGNPDFDTLLPMYEKNANNLFHISSNGYVTNRDEWAYDFSEKGIEKKAQFFIDEYESERKRWLNYKIEKNYTDIKAESNPLLDNFVHEKNSIKWSNRLKRDKLRKNRSFVFDPNCIIKSLYRPFVSKYSYYCYVMIDVKGNLDAIFPSKNPSTPTITLITGTAKPFSTLAVNNLYDLNFLSPAAGGTRGFPLYTYKNGNRLSNITDWGLQQFQLHYSNLLNIKKEDIFYYTYAVLHNPAYRKKYELNLKRDFPRLPFYTDFWKWAAWGKELMDLHIDYETVEPFSLHLSANFNPSESSKPTLKASTASGEIMVDENTTISGIPALAWEYKLGTRSAIEWILDQYKEKTPTDANIRKKFDTYKFADYKTHVIDLIRRVTTVSVRTIEIMNMMKTEEAHEN